MSTVREIAPMQYGEPENEYALKIGQAVELETHIKLIIYELQPGKAHEFLEFYKDEVVPWLRKVGMKEVYGWIICTATADLLIYTQSQDIPWENFAAARRFFKKLPPGAIKELPKADL